MAYPLLFGWAIGDESDGYSVKDGRITTLGRHLPNLPTASSSGG